MFWAVLVARKTAPLHRNGRRLFPFIRARTATDASQRAVRENLREKNAQYDKTEEDLQSLQSVGLILGEVLRPLDKDRCSWPSGRRGRRRR